MKKLLLIVVALLVTTLTFAQKKTEVLGTANVDLLLPAGKAATPFYNAGLGASLQVEFKSKKPISYVLASGYQVLAAKTNTRTLIQFPTMLGLKYRFSPSVSIQQSGGISVINNGIGVKFIYSPTICFEYERWMTNLKYTSTVFSGHQNDLSTFGIGFSYRF